MQAGNFPLRSHRGSVEKHRRQQIKLLYSRLSSLLPLTTSQVKLPLPALLDYSLTYVKNLKERIRGLETKKEELKDEIGSATENFALQAIELIENGPILEVNLVTSLHKGFMLHEVIRTLEEEGAQVISASYSTLIDRVIYTISSQALSSRIGIDTSRVHERLKVLSGIACLSPPWRGTKPGEIDLKRV